MTATLVPSSHGCPRLPGLLTCYKAAGSKGRALCYLEDLKVGQHFKTGSHALTEAEIIAFARQYDPQPFHTDPIAAKDTFFGGLAFRAGRRAAISMRLQVESGPQLAGGMISHRRTQLAPAHKAGRYYLTVESEILEVTPSRSGGQGFVPSKAETVNQKGALLQVQTSKLLVWRRKARLRSPNAGPSESQ